MNTYLMRPAVLLLVFCCICLTMRASAATSTVLTPPDATVVREVQAGGAQVYACRANAAGGFAWTLSGPNAILIDDDGTDFGVHSAGPTWKANDGSTIHADGAHPLAVVKRPGAVPELLLKVTSSEGSGVLSDVKYVQRADTGGGLAPDSGCDAAHNGATIAVHYSAIYTFFR